jgi:hypothetical protein
MKPKSQPTKCWMTKMKIKYSILKERQKKMQLELIWVNSSNPRLGSWERDYTMESKLKKVINPNH